MRLTRRQFLLNTSLGVAGVALSSCADSYQSGKHLNTPNVLLIKTDEHNPRISGPYGHPFVKTSNMDRLAAIGTVYENSYCNSPLCLPSRSSFMTGRYAFDIQTPNNSNAISFDYPTHGAVLSDHGIHTVIMGKIDIYKHSSKLGFDEVIMPYDRKAPGDMHISRDPLAIRENGSKRQYGYGNDDRNYIQDRTKVDAAIDWIDTKSRTLKKPWYLEVNVNAPHFPHFVTEKMWAYYQNHADLPKYGPEEETAKHPYLQDLKKHFQMDAFTEESARGLRRGYYGCISLVDNHIGRLIGSLKMTGQLDNTVVIYTSDHGEMLGKFGAWWKSTLLEDSVCVPLIIAGPGFGKNKRFKSCVDQLDLQATLFDILNVPKPSIRKGKSLLNRQDDYEKTIIFSEYQGHGVRGSSFMVRKGDFKYIWYYDAPAQLFDLKEDPDELKNLVSQIPEKVYEMESHLREFCDPEKEQQRTEQFIQKQLKVGMEMKKEQQKKRNKLRAGQFFS